MRSVLSRRQRDRCYCLAAMLLLACMSAGCGSKSPPLAKVRGKVLLDDKPLATGALSTVPPGGRAAHGVITDGEFELGTYGNSDGALIGTHKVSVVANAPSQGTGAEASPGKSLVPQRYTNADSSGLTIEVKAGETNTPTLKLTSP